MRVFLVHPPPYKGTCLVRQGRCLGTAVPGVRVDFPVFLAYVASVLREAGHTVAAADAIAEGLSLQTLRQRIEGFRPDVVVVETVPSTYNGDIRIADITKRIRENIYTVYYGWQASARPTDVLGSKNIDFVVRGEPERTFVDLLNTLEGDEELDSVEGLSFRKNGVIKHNPPRPLMKQLDLLPYPARDLFPVKQYIAEPLGQATTVVASRGCPYSCIFCASHLMNGSQVQLRNPKNVAEEIESIYYGFGTKTVLFYADTFTLWNDKKILQFCREILDRKLNIRWLINSRVDTLPSENALRYMARAGCLAIQFGVESGSLEMVEAMRKGRNSEECERYVNTIRSAIAKTKRAGIFTGVKMLVGFAGENLETVEESSNLMRECNPDMPVSFGIPIPFPGTSLGEVAEREGLLPPDGRGFSVDLLDIALQLYAKTNNTNADTVIELCKFANDTTRMSPIGKVRLALKLLAYFSRRGNLRVFLNMTRFATVANSMQAFS